ncbi:Uma2 family endonuclease [Sphingomonas sp. M1-B02]|uniref:Uma2 family endonuclease n=1 Tax=Sphingomonas sp. M1-B02 TaxID=3114300 RepID=UPI00223FD34B|nr:Uma2 family endonuclease [Sphingomonas sp. S6-11]UZK66979.1 Uma2 family endonuclease [Sphingomonas sp. S6-11]
MTEQRPLNTSPMPLKLRIEDYLALNELGAFADYAKTELIEGEIFFMNAQHRPHARLKGNLYRLLADALKSLGNDLEALVEVSVAIPPHDSPEPDIVVTSLPVGEGLVPVTSVALVVEVADTTLISDLGRKSVLYARAGIREYWVADVNARVIHQMWAPEDDGYVQRCEVAFGDRIEAATIPELTLETAGI